MDEIKIGIIGVRLQGNDHLRALHTIITEKYIEENTSIRIMALCDIDENLLKERKKEYPDIPYFFTNYRDLLKCDDINTVYIVTPTALHHEMFLAAAKAGKHIFCEKPVTDTIEKIDEMTKARDNAGIICQVGLVLRYEPIFWYIKKLYNTNRSSWGALQNVIFRDDQEKPYTGYGTHPSKWRSNPNLAYYGCLFEHSIHDIDILMWIFGDIKEVFSKVKYFAKIPPIEDSVCAIFELSNGGTVSLNSIWHNVEHDARNIELFFENAFLQISFSNLSRKIEIFEKGKKKQKLNEIKVDKIYREEMQLSSHERFWLMGYGYENIAFLKALIEDKKATPSLEDAKNAHKVVNACYKSSKEQKLIRI